MCTLWIFLESGLGYCWRLFWELAIGLWKCARVSSSVSIFICFLIFVAPTFPFHVLSVPFLILSLNYSSLFFHLLYSISFHPLPYSPSPTTISPPLLPLCLISPSSLLSLLLFDSFTLALTKEKVFINNRASFTASAASLRPMGDGGEKTRAAGVSWRPSSPCLTLKNNHGDTCLSVPLTYKYGLACVCLRDNIPIRLLVINGDTGKVAIGRGIFSLRGKTSNLSELATSRRRLGHDTARHM